LLARTSPLAKGFMSCLLKMDLLSPWFFFFQSKTSPTCHEHVDKKIKKNKKGT